MVGNGGADLGSEFVGGCLVEAILEQQIIPANDGIFDEAVAGLGDLLLLLVPGAEFTRVADGDRARESIAEFYPVEGSRSLCATRHRQCSLTLFPSPPAIPKAEARRLG